MNVQEQFAIACFVRMMAEATNDPELYEHAAAEFEVLLMHSTVARCRERAKHYRELQAVNAIAKQTVLS